MSSNYPPGVTESMLPGNRRDDLLHDRAEDEVYEDFVSVCEQHQRGCEYALIRLADHLNFDPEEEIPRFTRATSRSPRVNPEGVTVDGSRCMDYHECPYATAAIEARFDELMREGEVFHE